MCGDYDACSQILSNKCREDPDGDKYEATCRCGLNPSCEVDEKCTRGKCKKIKVRNDEGAATPASVPAVTPSTTHKGIEIFVIALLLY